MAAHDDHSVQARPKRRVAMREGASAWAGDHDHAALAAGGPFGDSVENSGDRLDPQHHAGTSPKRRVVGAFLPDKFVEQVMVAHVGEAALDGAAHNRKADKRRKEL